MSREQIEWLKPFISAMIIISTLFVVVFFKMEVRRLGYAVWKKNQILRKTKEEHQRLSVALVEKLQPGRIHKIAQMKLDMKKANPGQIIQMSQEKIALRFNQ
jgi:cell division protein FtsL